LIEPLASDDAGAQRRRSTRIVQAVPISVTGVDALGQPFKERTTTVMVNCHGCKYQSKHYVPKGSPITLEVPDTEPGRLRTVQGHVVWVQRPRTVRELFQIGLEFETAGNIWGIAFPPDDWFPCAEEVAPAETAEAAAPTVGSAGPQHLAAAPPPAPERLPQTPAAPPAASAPLAAAPAADAKIHVVTSPTVIQEVQPAAPQEQIARIVAEAKETLDKTARKQAQSAINEEMTIVRQQLDAQLHEAVEHAIRVSMERVSESAAKKVVQQAEDRTSAIVEEARKAGESNVANLDAKIRQAVSDAVTHAAEQAAQQAAQQTAAQNLKHTVESVVAKVVAEREAASPSLGILSSPEAAQEHIDQWKRNLEETAQTVRHQTLGQAQADADAASRRWSEQLEGTLTGASQRLGETLEEVSRVTVSQAEQSLAAKSSQLRHSIDEAIADAQAAMQTMDASLALQRARTNETTAQIEEAAKSTLDRTRQRLDEILASQTDEIARKADQVIADCAQQIEPLLHTSVRSAAERFAGEIDRTLASKLNTAEQAASELARARQQATELHNDLNRQMHLASEQTTRIQDAIQTEAQRAAQQAADAQNKIVEQMRLASEQAAQIQEAVRGEAQRAAEQAAQTQEIIRAQVQKASEEAVQESVDRMRQEAAKVPAEFEEACRATLSKVEEELEQRSTETQHATYEALLKASDWYQKKAQTTMQSALEKTVEQSTSTLRQRAAEISSLVASELDHYGRTYVDHSRAQIEEAAKENVDRGRAKMGEVANLTTADFAERIQGVTVESMRRFEEASRQALEKARSDLEYNRENSLTDFQNHLDEKMLLGVEQARTYLQSQLVPLLEEWEEKRQVQQREWMEQLKKSTNESIEHYKTRLENASNSWLLASATTLGQSSQAVIDTLAKSAEKRIRETCADVLAGMGDTLKERLIGISGQFGADQDDEPQPPQKKKS
jgi:hypothetical protein